MKYKLAALAALDTDFESMLGTLQTKAVKEVASVFVANAHRVVNTSRFPVRLVNLYPVFLPSWQKAKQDVFGSDDLPPSRYDDYLQKRDQLSHYCADIPREELKKVEEGRFGHVERRWESSLYYIDSMIAKSDDFLTDGLQAMLSSMVVGTWTAFEALAGDLWVAAVNAQPTYSAALMGDENRIDKLMKGGKSKASAPAADEADQDNDNPFDPLGAMKISLGLMCRVTEGSYDLGNKMGSLLLAAERVKFTSLKEIRKAYSLGFPEKVRGARSARIDTALADKGLDALSAVRNLIVHKAGIADSVYLDDCKSAPTAPRLKAKEVLHLDGEMCGKLITPAVKAAVELARAVDTWLTHTRR